MRKLGHHRSSDVKTRYEQPAKDVPTIEMSESQPTIAEPGALPEGDLSKDVRYEDGLIIRPYVRTGGRASAAYELRLETMLVSRIRWSEVNPNYRPPEFSDIGRICSLCEVPLSVAELSAYLKAPLGVVRILVCDAITQGLVLMSDDDADSGGRPSMETLRRVHEGLIRML